MILKKKNEKANTVVIVLPGVKRLISVINQDCSLPKPNGERTGHFEDKFELIQSTVIKSGPARRVSLVAGPVWV
jgi:hypothetical protein